MKQYDINRAEQLFNRKIGQTTWERFKAEPSKIKTGGFNWLSLFDIIKLLSKNKSFCIFCLLICHAIYVTFTTDIKIIGKGYRRNLFSMSHLNWVTNRTTSWKWKRKVKAVVAKAASKCSFAFIRLAVYSAC